MSPIPSADPVRWPKEVGAPSGQDHYSLPDVLPQDVIRRPRADVGNAAEAIRGVSDGLAAFFPPGTDPNHVTTAALPAIWQRSAEFAAAAQKLQREAAKLAAIAKSSDTRAFDAQFERVGAVCNECHKQFRKRDSD